MLKTVFYGSLQFWLRERNYIKLMEQNGDMQVLGFCCTDKPEYVNPDDCTAVSHTDLARMPFDYLLVLNRAEEKETIRTLTQTYCIPREKILPFRVLQIPGMTPAVFDEIRKKEWSVLCNNCFAGILFQHLGLRYNSPFKNGWLNCWDVMRLMKDLPHYMVLEPVFDHWEEANSPYDQKRFPVFRLDDILLHFNHHTDADAALEEYRRRAKRLNPDRLMAIIVTVSSNVEHAFQEFPAEYPKLCISSAPDHSPDTVWLPADNSLDLQDKANQMARDGVGPVDWVKFLLGRKDFLIRR